MKTSLLPTFALLCLLSPALADSTTPGVPAAHPFRGWDMTISNGTSSTQQPTCHSDETLVLDNHILMCAKSETLRQADWK